MTNSEDQITAWFAGQRKLPPKFFPIGIGDDMAEIRLAGGTSVLITTDMLLDGVHFDLRKASLKQVGYKAMAVNLSDCAAMATIPVAAVVSVALPKGYGARELKQLHAGIVKAADKYNCALVGGDITVWKGRTPFVINVAMISKPGPTKPLRRNGAKVGDIICVTGTLGGSGFGRHLRFEPRVREALELAQTVVIHSMMDISDGLSTDLNRICQQSGVGALLFAEQIPISKDAKRNKDPLSAALNDGEDFELLFTLSKKEYEKLRVRWNKKPPVTAAGIITDTKVMQIKTIAGKIRRLQPAGYDHLAD
jgi:thiamine-monophosphate kinase